MEKGTWLSANAALQAETIKTRPRKIFFKLSKFKLHGVKGIHAMKSFIQLNH